MIDDTGYFLNDSSDLMETLGCSQLEIDNVFEKLQYFEPAGVLPAICPSAWHFN